MVRSLLLTFVMLLGGTFLLAQNTVLTGTVADNDGEALPGVTVKVSKGAEFVKGGSTDINGVFRLQLDPGTYTVEFSYTGYPNQKQTGVEVLSGKLNQLDISMSNTIIKEVEIKYSRPLIQQDKTTTGQEFTSAEIKKLPTRSVTAIVGTTAGVSTGDDGSINIRGSRSNGSYFFLDGIRVFGSLPPVQDIEQLSVMVGGLGAEYGDMTGGATSIILKGAASEYHGALEIENSHGLDPYGWLLGTANISGPIWKKKTPYGKRTVLGFRLSGQFNSQKDDDPPATPVYLAKESVRKRIEQHPLTQVGPNQFYTTAQQLTNDSVDVYDYRPFEKRQDIDINTKLDLRITERMDFSVTGTFKDIRNQFTPGGWRLLNTENNPTDYDNRYRVITRFRHRLGAEDSDEKNADKSVFISNAYYQLQFAFERAAGKNYDPRHEDRLFDYGFVGRSNWTYDPIIGDDSTGTMLVHLDNRETFRSFQPGYINAAGNLVTPNPGLLNYNEFANAENINTFRAYNGFVDGAYDDIWSGMHSNTGLVYNSFSKSLGDIVTINATSGFDLKLGKTGIHSIQFGLINEQRVQRAYAVAPFELWLLGRNSINNHIVGLDSIVIGDTIVDGQTVNLYRNLIREDNPDLKFYRKVRESLGVDVHQWVNIDELRPDQLSLDMFSARELNEQGYINYYGYDYTGKLLGNGVTFDDFFKSRDADGVRDFPVAALNPLYQAAYIKDKFTFNKMIFSLGVRVERFDLNTKVMRDQYSLYNIMSAKQYFETIPIAGNRPGTIGDDFKVYVEGPNNLRPKAFRSGDVWYDANGNQVNDGRTIFGGGVVTPMFADYSASRGNIPVEIADTLFDPNSTFVDYTPQVNWLPRLSFSFPISKEANFFAHYDVLIQRPTSNWEVTPLNYFYFNVPGRTPANNANLKPERVVDYEVGFQQKLNQNSAIKLSAYYREMRDMIQSRTIQQVPIISSYETYGNIDYSTVKGFSFQYDLRRTRNLEMRIAYTLQFADGTGSNPNTQRGLTRRGNIRTLFPLDYDERHNIQSIIDYRFDEGDAYSGPRLFGTRFLENFGINMIVSAVSGRPYTQNLRPVRFGGEGTVGSINGNRLPWRFNVDLRADKTFNLTAANKKPLILNVYFRVSNLLNRRNVVGVYAATGSPTDDGYLASGEGAGVLRAVQEQGFNLDAYLSSYSWILRNPNLFSQPRRMFIGAAFSF